jgi:hypothetical protein
MAMAQEPDSLQPANVRLIWKPPGEKKSIDVEFASVVTAAVAAWHGRQMDLALVVPGGLGPGPREELLKQLGRYFRHVEFIPRPIAVALAWCVTEEGLTELVRSGNLESGKRLGALLVTTASADTWEVALVPVRTDGNGPEKLLCPVHDRTQQGAEYGYVGVAWEYASMRAGLGASDQSASWLQPQALSAHEPSELEYQRAEEELRSFSRHWSRDAGHEVPSERSRELVEHLGRVLPGTNLLGWCHAGIVGKDGPPRAFRSVGNALAESAATLATDAMLTGAGEAMRRLHMERVPYFEALAPLELHVLGRNSFRDPVTDWAKLIEEAEVPAGREYCSPEPITGMSLPAGRVPSVSLYIRTKRRGEWEYRTATAELQEPTDRPEPVLITARMRPGQGLAHVDVTSETADLFTTSVHEGRLKRTDSPPALKYAWPPGSAYVISHPIMTEGAWPAIEAAFDQARNGIARWEDIAAARASMNQWAVPESLEISTEELEFPPEIHPVFVYLGVFPSDRATADPAIEQKARQYGALLASTLEDRTDDKVYWAASWLYARCPKLPLDRVRAALRSGSRISGGMLACAGNCFTETADYKLFFSALASSIENAHPIANEYWVRAYRNLARFRASALSFSALTEEQQGSILDWYLTTFEAAIVPYKPRDYLHCVYLTPHILKRRRFDPEFMRPSTEEADRFEKVLRKAVRVVISRKHRANLECALEFLRQEATLQTLQRLRDNE